LLFKAVVVLYETKDSLPIRREIYVVIDVPVFYIYPTWKYAASKPVSSAATPPQTIRFRVSIRPPFIKCARRSTPPQATQIARLAV